jgi:hypothetical protein
MYNVGFGDCFLIEIPRTDQIPFRALVDCGAHTSGYPREGWTPEETVDQIIVDVTDGDHEPFIDLVIASHRHQDHVSGFRAPAWANVRVGEVWMPWTEHPTDPLAKDIRTRQSRLALGLNLSFNDERFWANWTSPAARDSLQSLAANSLTNEAAMTTLHRGFRGRPKRRFLPETTDQTVTPATCPGLTIHVLGPSKDPDVVRDMDPPAGQSYLRYTESQTAPSTSQRRSSTKGPFAANFTFEEARYVGEGLGPVLDQKVKDAAGSIMRGDDFTAAVSLDKAVNGTSLMLMFEFGEAFLLFPGDAQWGTWNAALSDPETRDLLARTTFYKVGHHGSHNATPIEFVEGVLDQNIQIWGSAISVRPIGFWPEIPRDPLVDKLHLRSERLIRSDHPGRSRAGVSVRKGKVGVDFKVPC